jgi:hypothetical protein
LKKETAKGKLAKGKRLTAAIHVCAEGHHVGQFALDIIRRTSENKKKVTSDKRKKKQKEKQNLNQKVMAALAKGNSPECWTDTNLKHIVQWYRLDGDAALANKCAGLVEQYEKTKHRIVEDVVVVSTAANQEPINADVVLHAAVLSSDLVPLLPPPSPPDLMPLPMPTPPMNKNQLLPLLCLVPPPPDLVLLPPPPTNKTKSLPLLCFVPLLWKTCSWPSNLQIEGSKRQQRG